MEHNELSLTDNFKEYFSVKLATTPEQLEKVYRVRYRVYCEELNYEPVENFPDEMEHDQFDEHSLHCLIVHKRSGLPAGCVRLVVAGNTREPLALPMEHYCLHCLSNRTVKLMDENRSTICEISRLCVDKLFRRRHGESRNRLGQMGAMDASHHETRAFSLIAIAGFMAGVALAEYSGRTYIFAMMEPLLPRLLRRSGIYCRRAGTMTDFHGERGPFYTSSQTILRKIDPELGDLYQDIYQQFTANEQLLAQLIRNGIGMAPGHS